mmetsp:Transcript_2276/g.5251  ORF Transcript_2276/g.5251 Transcript_2276/m.5251 type:complete len:205 (-) Transcript_2276:1228-1842(-)
MPCSGFMAGKRITSLMVFLLVRNMARRSIPRPQPAVGGRPTSRASMKPSSMGWASSSPAALSFICSSKRARWSTGSFNSVYALASSLVATKSSKRSVRNSSSRCFLASGDMTSGWSVRKVGLMHWASRNSPTRVSNMREAVRGGEQSSWCFLRRSFMSFMDSSPARSLGKVTPRISSRPDFMEMRLKGGLKSIVSGSSAPRGRY